MENKKIQETQIKPILKTGFALGVLNASVHVSTWFIGMLMFPYGMNAAGETKTDVPSTLSFLNSILGPVGQIEKITLPYFLAAGIISALLYTFLFPNKETRFVLLFWAVLMAGLAISISTSFLNLSEISYAFLC